MSSARLQRRVVDGALAAHSPDESDDSALDAALEQPRDAAQLRRGLRQLAEVACAAAAVQARVGRSGHPRTPLVARRLLRGGYDDSRRTLPGSGGGGAGGASSSSRTRPCSNSCCCA